MSIERVRGCNWVGMHKTGLGWHAFHRIYNRPEQVSAAELARLIAHLSARTREQFERWWAHNQVGPVLIEVSPPIGAPTR